jgi:competence ComEA-like helix-hairpin-helix protein
MKEWIKDYFTFNRGEQRGLVLLLGLLLLSILFSYIAPQLVRSKKYDSAEFRVQVEAFLNDSVRMVKEYPGKPANDFAVSSSATQSSITTFLSDPFYFDPNKIGEEEWKKTGLEDRIISNILKYRQKGGFFRNKEDFSKIYGLDEATFSILEPYIIISDEKIFKSSFSGDSNRIEKRDTKPEKFEDETVSILELNTVDSSGLLALPGIGPSFASRIIRYRELLGGFALVSQLMEVRGMDSVRFNEIRERLTVNPELIRKMDLNAVTFKEMVKHPYFEYYLVKAIFNYKDRIRQFDSVGQVGQIENIYPELFKKIEPYLEVRKQE